ncbi:MAG: hypothetical protein D6734_01385 [Candidatus Schekmanbacteria bacterium]|nr:MAG: hypothetical protein D6734_01385 [Candidatus Schekmanbacteria bacterium]
MLDSQKVKDFLYEECAAEVVGIAPANPFSEEHKKRVLASQDILKSANPMMSAASGIYDPQDFVDNAQSVIVFGRNSFFGPEFMSDSNKSDGPRGTIGNFYLNERILNRAIEQASKLQDFLNAEGYNSDSPFQGFPQKIKAVEAGIGFYGKNTLVLNEKLGTWTSISTVITDAPLEPDKPMERDCGNCRKCVEACPTGALTNEYTLQVDKCLIYYLCHLKGEIPLEVRDKIGVRIGTCLVCSDICPYNRKITLNTQDRLPDEEIYPYLIPLLNISQEEYDKKYGDKMFGLIIGGRRYLRRNIAVALGNANDKSALPALEIAAKDEDELVRSHAQWAIDKLSS